MTTADPPPRVGELPEISVEAVKSLAAGSLFEVSPELEARLAGLIDRGNAEIGQRRTLGLRRKVDEDSAEYAERSRLARENLSQLVQGMVEEAALRGTTVLDLQTLDAAMSRLCPLPPWCK